MPEKTDLLDLYTSQSKELHLEWIAGKQNQTKHFFNTATNPATGTVGYFNLIHSNQIQILGTTELNYLTSLNQAMKQEALDKLFGEDTIVAIVTDNCKTLPEMVDLSEKRNVALFISDLPGEKLVNDLRYYLSHLLADKVHLHGVFMEVLSVGVFLKGASGIGKSELALELITRGHRLIADDAPLFARIAPDIIMGTALPMIQDFLEVRGLGVINIRKMYGNTAIKASKYLKLIIDLQPTDKVNDETQNRLIATEKTFDVLGLEIPTFLIPVAPGRNLAVLVEAAVKNYLLELRHYSAYNDIVSRQAQALNEQ